jgi:hypothetical protein
MLPEIRAAKLGRELINKHSRTSVRMSASALEAAVATCEFAPEVQAILQLASFASYSAGCLPISSVQNEIAWYRSDREEAV